MPVAPLRVDLVPWALVGLAGCAGDGDGPGRGGPEPASWTVVAEDLPGALLHVTGAASDDVWVVGADVGGGPQVLAWDGAAWAGFDVGSAGDLWWSWRAGPDALVLVGEGGRVVTLAPSTGEVTTEVLDAEPGDDFTPTFFGVWGSGPDDVWVVGGVLPLTGGAEVWHRGPAGWARVPLPPEAQAQVALYKVWGAGPDDVWICGAGGVLLRGGPSGLAALPTGTTAPLFTVNGDGDARYVVGGAGAGTLLSFEGDALVDRSPSPSTLIQGVWAAGPIAVGWDGGVYTPDDAGVWRAEGAPVVDSDLHAVWVDPDGGAWAVGGDLRSAALGAGSLVYRGGAPPADPSAAARP